MQALDMRLGRGLVFRPGRLFKVTALCCIAHPYCTEFYG